MSIKRKLVILGGTSPLAIECAKDFILNGHKVLLLSRNPDNENLAGLKAMDVRIEKFEMNRVRNSNYISDFNNLITSYKPNSLIFANRSRDLTLEETLNVDVVAPYELIKSFSALPATASTSVKSVVIVSSVVSKLIQNKQNVGYHISKAALNQLVRYFAVEYQTYKVRINTVSPGAFISKERSTQYYKENVDLFNSIQKSIPLMRFGTNQDIIEGIKYLLSDGSSFVNGQDLVIDGGFYLQDGSVFIEKN
jgi:NAD(P)-dependent dehydrogenase (short-subunit alcohol dehydrogenase family)